MKILLLDNYDSFTYNIYQLMERLGADVEVIRNDKTTVGDIEDAHYDAIVLSPGPGVPAEAGLTEEVIRHFGGKLPILGVCLGHQAIGEVFGGQVVRAAEIVHGKSSPIHHDGKGLYAGIPEDTPIGRYHSLIVDRETLPDCLTVTSELADGTIMGLRHKEMDIEGIQFHPESILSPDGPKMMENFLHHVGEV